MLSTIIQKFTRTSPPDMATNEAAELLASCNLPNADDLLRLRARITAVLAVVSPVRKFRRAPENAFTALPHDLRAAADEIERHHAPGMPRAAVPWPTGAQELIDALKGGTA